MTDLTVIQKRDAIASGKQKAVDNIQFFLDEISERNGAINAFLRTNDKAIEQAQKVDAKIAAGEQVGVLAGLAIGVKANISVVGQNVSCASKTLENYKGTFDADVIKRIQDEDGIIIGMTNMDEFACGGSGTTSAFGVTQNPSAPGKIPGGTSSGSAAAVAAGLCDMALGSDTGGSIRNPASHCGVVGIKPSYGRVSRYGLVDSAMSFDQIGPLADDVEGAALLLKVIAGVSDNDPTTVAHDVGNYDVGADNNITIGVCSDFEKLCSDKNIWNTIVEDVVSPLVEKGAKRVDVSLAHIDLAVQTYYPIQYVEFYSGTRKFDGRKYGSKIEDVAGEEVLRRIFGGKEISKAEHKGAYYRKALQVKKAIADSFDAAFKECDVIVSPVTPVLPHNVGDDVSAEDMYALDAFTVPANLAGICAGVVPVGRIDDVPVGVQVFAPAFAEEKLIAVMKAIEQLSK